MRGVIEQLGTEEFVFISLSVESNLSSENLTAYADRNGFDWIFAVITPEMLQALVDQFGRAAASPPSTPHFIIGPSGQVSDLHAGGAVGADGLITEITAAQASG